MFALAAMDLASCSASQISDAVNSSLLAITTAIGAVTAAIGTLIAVWRQGTTNKKVEESTAASVANSVRLEDVKVAAEGVSAKVDAITTAVVTNPPSSNQEPSR